MPDLHIVLYIAWKAAFKLLRLVRCADEWGITQTALVVHTVLEEAMHTASQFTVLLPVFGPHRAQQLHNYFFCKLHQCISYVSASRQHD